MTRLTRLVIPGYPHHVTQRGVRSIDIFASDERYSGDMNDIPRYSGNIPGT